MTRRRRAGAATWVLLAVGLALVGGCDGEPPAEPVRVLLVGDSITAGMVSEPKGPAYAELLAESLGPRFEVVNLGCGGSSTLDWTRSRGSDLCAGEPMLPSLYEKRVRKALPADLVTVLLGTNDAQGVNEPKWIPAQEYEVALREIATALLADGAQRVMLLSPPPVLHNTRAMMRVMRYGEAVRRVCAANERVLCGPDVRHLLEVDDFEEGNLHPNGEGHRKIAEALARAVRSLYAEERDDDESSDAAAASSSPGSPQIASAPAASSSSRLP